MSLSQNKVTDNTHEMSFHELVSQSAQIRIPLFQRPYVWKVKQLTRMQEEIAAIAEGADANFFLGAITAVRRENNPAAPQIFEIVDGQQRLTTLYLFVMAGAQVAESNGLRDYARSLINQNLIVDWHRSEVNTKIVPSYNDRGQFCECWNTLFSTGDLGDEMGARVVLPDSTGSSSGPLLTQYQRIRRYLRQIFSKSGEDHFYKILEACRTKLTYVFILLKDPATATTVFQGLNDNGMPITVGDLVRNEIFSRTGDNAAEAVAIHQQHWVPFEQRLRNQPLFDGFFFPYCVLHQPNTLRAEMFNQLRSLWGRGMTAAEIIAGMNAYTSAYLSIADEPVDVYPKSIRAVLARLQEANSPNAVFPFVMRLLYEYELSNVDESRVSEVLTIIESFLVRRALCGIEPTGLLGMFRTMWNVMTNDHGGISRESIVAVIKARQTIDWPDDDRLRDQIKNRRFYESSISRHVLLEYDRSLGGDFPIGVEMWAEHVMPQKLTAAWQSVIDPSEHERLVHTWANIIPLSKEMNSHLKQQLYSEKQKVFRDDSAFKTARRVAQDYDTWNQASLEKRAAQLADWAVSRWPVH